MKPHKHADILRDYAKGHSIQVKLGESWFSVINPTFSKEYFYRIAAKEKVSFNRGYRFEIEGEEYILAAVSEKQMVLVDVRDGNRYTNYMSVASNYSVTEKELFSLAKGVEFKVITK